jgi:hypothetical protein
LFRRSAGVDQILKYLAKLADKSRGLKCRM